MVHISVPFPFHVSFCHVRCRRHHSGIFQVAPVDTTEAHATAAAAAAAAVDGCAVAMNSGAPKALLMSGDDVSRRGVAMIVIRVDIVPVAGIIVGNSTGRVSASGGRRRERRRRDDATGRWPPTR